MEVAVWAAMEEAMVRAAATAADSRMYAYKNMSLAIHRNVVHRCWLEWSQQYQSTSMNTSNCFHNQILLLLLSNSATRPMYNWCLCP